jgi:hyperosmotically inducible periplasmic protein
LSRPFFNNKREEKNHGEYQKYSRKGDQSMKGMAKYAAFTLPVLLIAGALVAPVMGKDKGSSLSDTTIQSIVEYQLSQKGLQRDNNIQVKVDDHVVTLTGTVHSLGEKQRAEQIARSAPDVSGVENRLTVEAGRESDQGIANQVTRAIRSHPFFDIFDWVEGTVQGGVVTLKGAVREPWRRQEYQRLAEAVPGVTQVNNQIEVLPTSIYDDQIRVAAARAIYGDPRFARYANRSLPPIHIIVKNGNVTLEGAVGSPLEKQLAEMLVRTEVMSFQVVNNLRVDNQMESKPA